MKGLRWWWLPALALGLHACRGATAPASPTAPPSSGLRVWSPAFDYGARIPVQYTCDGPDRIPPLRWEGLPAGTKSLVLIMDDPDAPMGTWVHWVVFDIPPETQGIEEGQAPPGRSGRNSWGRTGYGGPCPPRGKPHRYFFRLYALDVPTLGLPEGASREQVDRAMQGHILAQAEWMGTYGR